MKNLTTSSIDDLCKRKSQAWLFLSSVFAFAFAALVALTFSQGEAEATEGKDFSYMKASRGDEHRVQCFGGFTRDKVLMTRAVDPAVLNLQFRAWSDGKNLPTSKQIYSGITFENKKLVSKKYYDCEVFDQAIKAAPSLFMTAQLEVGDSSRQVPRKSITPKGKLNCDDDHQSSMDEFKGLAQKISWFSKKDLREELSDKEFYGTYSAVGQFREKSFFTKFNHNDEKLGPVSAVLVACPDGINDVVVTNAHAFRSTLKKGPHAGIPLKDFKFSAGLGEAHEIESMTYGGEPLKGVKGSVERDWAVVKLKTPVGQERGESFFKPLTIDARSQTQYTGCVRSVAWHNDLLGTKPTALRKQTCEIKSIERGETSDIYKPAGQEVSIVRHNCHAVNGSSGGALVACDSGRLVGINKGAWKTSKGDEGTPYSYKIAGKKHFSVGLLLSGKFLKAVNWTCAQYRTLTP